MNELAWAENRTESKVQPKVEHVFQAEAELRICETPRSRADAAVCDLRALINLFLTRKNPFLVA